MVAHSGSMQSTRRICAQNLTPPTLQLLHVGSNITVFEFKVRVFLFVDTEAVSFVRIMYTSSIIDLYCIFRSYLRPHIRGQLCHLPQCRAMALSGVPCYYSHLPLATCYVNVWRIGVPLVRPRGSKILRVWWSW